MAEKSVYKKPAFIVALVICLLFLAVGTIFSVPFKTVSDQFFAFMTNNLGWSFIWGASLFVYQLIPDVQPDRKSGSAKTMSGRSIQTLPGLRCSSAAAWGSGSSSGVFRNRSGIICGRRSGRLTAPKPATWLYAIPSSTGGSTPGRSMPWSGLPSLISPTVKGCR